MAEHKTVEKARNFTFLIYPDSAPDDWVTRLESLGIPMAISPIHDKDKSLDMETSGNEFKKAHYHVIYRANNPITKDSVRRKIQRTLGVSNAVNKVEIVDNIINMYKYLTHESNDAIRQKKYKYLKSDIKHLNNFDIDRYITFSTDEQNELLNKITGLIVEFKLLNVIDLESFIAHHGNEYGISRNELMVIVRSRAGVLRLYFDGVYQNSKYNIEKNSIKDE